jgi:CHAD domain-containing protein
MRTDMVETKHETGLGVTSLARKRVSRDGRRVTRRTPAAQVLLAYLDQQAARLGFLEAAVRRAEPDAVHQMRVTVRRLRSVLRSYQTVLAGTATRHLSDELKGLGGVLGEARDNQVLSRWLHGALASTPPELVLGPAQARVTAHFAPRQATAQRAVLEALDSPRYAAILAELSRLLDDPPLTVAAAKPAAKVLPDGADRQYRRARRSMRRARRTPAGPAREVALHDVRKAARRARYAAEAAQPAFGNKARKFARRMKAVQSVLGDYHDAVKAGEAAREIGVRAHLAGENAFSFGLLQARAHGDAAGHESQARQVWKRVSRARPRTWAR